LEEKNYFHFHEQWCLLSFVLLHPLLVCMLDGLASTHVTVALLTIRMMDSMYPISYLWFVLFWWGFNLLSTIYSILSGFSSHHIRCHLSNICQIKYSLLWSNDDCYF
jgi:hypothetical protein